MIFEIIFLIIAKQQLKQGDLIADRQLNLTTDKEYTKELLEELQRELAAAVRGDNGERIVIAIWNGDMDCLGNGKHFDENGQPIEIYCEECNYLMLCRDEQRDEEDMMNMFKFFDSLISSK